jgi:Uma2 family endonuclease
VPTATDDPTTPREPVPYGRVTSQAYLVRERAAEYRSEYHDGEIVAMGGASRPHSLICGNLNRHLGNQLEGRGCEVHGSDMRVRLDAGRKYAYPDVSVACGGAVFEDDEVDVLLNPTVVIEVLSGSTEKKDRGWKFDAYRRIPSLREIVFLSQGAAMAEVYRRDAEGGEWVSHLPLNGVDAILRLESIGCALPLAQVYAGALDETPRPRL